MNNSINNIRLTNHLFLFYFFIILYSFSSTILFSQQLIPADNPNIQYYGRWDDADPKNLKHSWPGVYVYAGFTGSSIGLIMNDSINYYNVYIDGQFYKVFHGDKSGDANYTLAENLSEGKHSILISKRNIVFGKVFSFSGFILENDAELLEVELKPERKIEFIGDSFTAAESNEATEQEISWEARFPVTNIDKGFAPLIAKYFNAQYTTTCRSGSGMVCDWQGNPENSIPNIFDRALMEAKEPEWNFKKWIPDFVVICLGLNDFSGLKDKNGNVPDEKSVLFRKGFHEFISRLDSVYPGVRILAVAAFPDWIRENVNKVVDEEKTKENKNIFYSQFDYFPGGYVANGHPTVETHKKMADQIIASIDSFKIFSK